MRQKSAKIREWMKIKPGGYALASLLLLGCGTQGIKSFQADNAIRADYLADSVRVTFKAIPRCRTIHWFYFWWTEKCGEPYAIQIHFVSKHKSRNSNAVQFGRLILFSENRETELLNNEAGKDIIALNPSPNGTSEYTFEVGLGSGIRETSKAPFRIVLSYKLGNQSEFSEVEKGFYFYERRRWRPLFLK